MRLPVRLQVLCRILYGLFALVSAFYCLLAWIPFTWQQVIQGHLLPALSTFAAQHHWLNLVALAVLALSLGKPRRSVVQLLVAEAVLAFLFVLRPVLPSLKNEVSSLLWAAVLIAPLAWLGLLDLLHFQRQLVWPTRQGPADPRAFYAAWRSALFTAVVAIVIPFAAAGAPGTPHPVISMLWATGAHFVVFAWVYIALAFAAGFASFFARPARFEFAVIQLLFFAVLFALFAAKIFPAISFQGGLATVCAAVVSASLCLYGAGLAVSIAGAPRPFRITTGLDMALLPGTTLAGSTRGTCIAGLVFLALGTTVASTAASSLDWNYLGQEIVAFGCWVSAFSLFYGLSGMGETRLRSSLLASMGALGVCAGYAAAYSGVGPAKILQDYAGRNISYRLASELLSPPVEDGTFYAFLNASSNIARSTLLAPVNIELAGKLTPAGGEKPNIFVVVVDSLRRDYLGVYNPKVGFTPQLDSFARESVAFRNAFTHYGGTGLAEPSIWVGGMMLHKQYVTPFGKMNSLAKLADAEGYRKFVSMDTILETVTPRSGEMNELDKGRLTMDYDLCGSLSELQGKVKPGQPVFAYTQPQNLHISVIARQGKSVPEGESYPGFYAPYASRLRRIDACFGQFISHLKQAGLYESSVIVLTADHGDSLGEDGRWGHAYTIFPEIVRVPLIIHAPEAMRKALVGAADRLVFTTDITPTFYQMLGHTPGSPGEMFGHSLLGPAPATQSFLIAASYAAVYGLLSRQGRRLYISDGVAARDYLYDLTAGPAGAALDPSVPDPSVLDPSNEERDSSHKRIRQLVDEINAFYSFRPQASQ